MIILLGKSHQIRSDQIRSDPFLSLFLTIATLLLVQKDLMDVSLFPVSLSCPQLSVDDDRLHAFETLLDPSRNATESKVEMNSFRRLCARGKLRFPFPVGIFSSPLVEMDQG